MRRARRKLLAAALLTACALPAAADGVDGHALLARCSAYEQSQAEATLSAQQTLDAMWCMGYVSGLLDGFGVSDYRIGNTVAACPADPAIDRREAVGIITRWLREHPQELDKSGRRSAILAIAGAFPCRAR